jgi:phenylacetate-CoA ligase
MLKNFQVINKNIIRENFNDFISDDYEKAKLYKVTTSGSTGTPFMVYQDKNKRRRHIADNIYFNELANTYIGSKLYYFRIWNKVNIKSSLVCWLQNLSMQDAGVLSDSRLNAVIRLIIKDTSTKSLLAYASTFEAIGNHLSRHYTKPVPARINAVISMSETLPDYIKKQLTYLLSCPVISRYSNMENGFLAQQCIADNEEYHINYASFFIEVLDLEKDEAVSDGEMGRIVVTDLFNFAMPLIRYDTGDIGVMDNTSNCLLKTPVFRKIEGRRVDFISDTKDNLLSPHVITNTMWKYSEIKQFQFVQIDASNYIIKLNYEGNNYARESELIADLKNYLGPDAIISVEYFSEIPMLASGKRKKIINLKNSNI